MAKERESAENKNELSKFQNAHREQYKAISVDTNNKKRRVPKKLMLSAWAY